MPCIAVMIIRKLVRIICYEGDPVLETYVRKGQLHLCEECAGQGPRLEVL